MNNKTKIIFLDIDGVLVHNKINLRETVHIKDLELHPADTKCITILEDIIKQTDASIVLSSTWRMFGFNIMKRWFNHFSGLLCERLIDFTPTMHHIIFNQRFTEISTWLVKHPETKKFIIIDDDSVVPAENSILKNFIHIKNGWVQEGIQLSHQEEAIKILNNKEL